MFIIKWWNFKTNILFLKEMWSKNSPLIKNMVKHKGTKHSKIWKNWRGNTCESFWEKRKKNSMMKPSELRDISK